MKSFCFVVVAAAAALAGCKGASDLAREVVESAAEAVIDPVREVQVSDPVPVDWVFAGIRLGDPVPEQVRDFYLRVQTTRSPTVFWTPHKGKRTPQVVDGVWAEYEELDGRVSKVTLFVDKYTWDELFDQLMANLGAAHGVRYLHEFRGECLWWKESRGFVYVEAEPKFSGPLGFDPETQLGYRVVVESHEGVAAWEAVVQAEKAQKASQLDDAFGG